MMWFLRLILNVERDGLFLIAGLREFQKVAP